MPTDWRTPYQAALRERAPARVAEACQSARAAIHRRAAELLDDPAGTPAELRELQELEKALQATWVHWAEFQTKTIPSATDWRTSYEAAIRERDPAKLHEACEFARRAIEARALELAAQHAADGPEQEELDEALRRIFIHERSSGKER